MNWASIFETLMIICFGLSWPLSILRSLRTKSTKGKSPFFMCFIAVGYLCGIAAKLISHTYNLAFWFYFPNTIMGSVDIFLYFHYRHREHLCPNCQGRTTEAQ